MPKAQHPKVASFVRQNLFAGVTSFVELEARIAALSDEHSRGCAFEAFAEAYLPTQRKHDATKFLPLSSIPTTILQTLGLGQQDYINVATADKAAAKVVKLGGKICLAKTAVPEMGCFVVCLDSENNPFALWEINRDAK